jgi:hypothetical protein
VGRANGLGRHLDPRAKRLEARPGPTTGRITSALRSPRQWSISDCTAAAAGWSAVAPSAVALIAPTLVPQRITGRSPRSSSTDSAPTS